jgi:hypothetical protein
LFREVLTMLYVHVSFGLERGFAIGRYG